MRSGISRVRTKMWQTRYRFFPERAFPPMSSQRRIVHMLQKRVSNSRFSPWNGGYQRQRCSRAPDLTLKASVLASDSGSGPLAPEPTNCQRALRWKLLCSGAKRSRALIGPSRFQEIKRVTRDTSSWPQIARLITLFVLWLLTHGIWILSEVDGRVRSRPQSPNRWSVSCIALVVARPRTSFRARRTSCANPPTLPNAVDLSNHRAHEAR